MIPEKTIHDRKERDLKSGGKLTVEYFNPDELKGKAPEMMNFKNNEWMYRTKRFAERGSPNSQEDIFYGLYLEIIEKY